MGGGDPAAALGARTLSDRDFASAGELAVHMAGIREAHPARPSFAAAARRLLLWSRCLLVLGMGLAILPAAARADVPAVDGISDQSLPTWDAGFVGSSFAQAFDSDWVAGARLRYARYVVQWNAMSNGYSAERSLFESWLDDVARIGLTPVLALTSYDDHYPRSVPEYLAGLAGLLSWAQQAGHPIAYIEPWNEPNNQGHRTPAAAARLANAAHMACEAGYGCTVVAGDFEDAPGLARYERAYERDLGFEPTIWGVHPYRSVEDMNEGPYLNFARNLPRQGAGAQIWFTEIAARRCTDYDGTLNEHGEAGQVRRAQWLVNTLMRNRAPAHVFYYGFLLGGYRQPSCAQEREDGALYAPSGEPPKVEDRPRAAASVIWAATRVESSGGGRCAARGATSTDPLAPPAECGFAAPLSLQRL